MYSFDNLKKLYTVMVDEALVKGGCHDLQKY